MGRRNEAHLLLVCFLIGNVYFPRPCVAAHKRHESDDDDDDSKGSGEVHAHESLSDSHPLHSVTLDERHGHEVQRELAQCKYLKSKTQRLERQVGRLFTTIHNRTHELAVARAEIVGMQELFDGQLREKENSYRRLKEHHDTEHKRLSQLEQVQVNQSKQLLKHPQQQPQAASQSSASRSKSLQSQRAPMLSAPQASTLELVEQLQQQLATQQQEHRLELRRELLKRQELHDKEVRELREQLDALQHGQPRQYPNASAQKPQGEVQRLKEELKEVKEQRALDQRQLLLTQDQQRKQQDSELQELNELLGLLQEKQLHPCLEQQQEVEKLQQELEERKEQRTLEQRQQLVKQQLQLQQLQEQHELETNELRQQLSTAQQTVQQTEEQTLPLNLERKGLEDPQALPHEIQKSLEQDVEKLQQQLEEHREQRTLEQRQQLVKQQLQLQQEQEQHELERSELAQQLALAHAQYKSLQGRWEEQQEEIQKQQQELKQQRQQSTLEQQRQLLKQQQVQQQQEEQHDLELKSLNEKVRLLQQQQQQQPQQQQQQQQQQERDGHSQQQQQEQELLLKLKQQQGEQQQQQVKLAQEKQELEQKQQLVRQLIKDLQKELQGRAEDRSKEVEEAVQRACPQQPRSVQASSPQSSSSNNKREASLLAEMYELRRTFSKKLRDMQGDLDASVARAQAAEEALAAAGGTASSVAGPSTTPHLRSQTRNARLENDGDGSGDNAAGRERIRSLVMMASHTTANAESAAGCEDVVAKLTVRHEQELKLKDSACASATNNLKDQMKVLAEALAANNKIQDQMQHQVLTLERHHQSTRADMLRSALHHRREDSY